MTQRDLAATRTQLLAWFAHRFAGRPVVVSDLRAANKAAGWSSESLMFTAEVGGKTDDYVIRIRFFTDPAGPDEEIQVGSFAAKSFASWP